MARAKPAALRVAIYARVSTSGQEVENQLHDLRLFVRQRGWVIQSEYVDAGVSGTKESRPALDRLLAVARKGQVEVLLVWRLDRLGRSVKHLVLLLDELRRLGVSFVSLHENLDSNSPVGKAVLGIFAVLAEMERELIVQRVQAGLARARREGKRLGRPPVVIDWTRLQKYARKHMSVRAMSKHLGISRGTVARALRTLKRRRGRRTRERKP
ncbi:MAG: recombinase family protein [Planctomycetes bacterium]|nr:recombinase family protein [Planctomycetota bacterium]